jgi:hypothetical protein
MNFYSLQLATSSASPTSSSASCWPYPLAVIMSTEYSENVKMVDLPKYKKITYSINITQKEYLTWVNVQCTYNIHYSVYFNVTMLEMYELLKTLEYDNTIFHRLWIRREFE